MFFICSKVSQINQKKTYFSKEAGVEFVPLRSLQVGLLQNGSLAKDINLSPNEEVPALELLGVTDISRVNLLDVVLCVLDNDFVRLAVQSVDDLDQVLLSLLNPPRREAQTLDVV